VEATSRSVINSMIAPVVVCNSASATTDYARTISQLGIQNVTPTVVYFNVVEGFTLNCQWNYIYLDITTDFRRGAYAQLLSAKISDRLLSRTDYTQPGVPGTQCNLSLVEVMN
jgi:hypothetical protein